jgi:hypothetical protein
MRRTSWALLAGLLILLPGAGQAADQAAPAGNWKMSVFQRGRMQLVGLVQFESAGGKWSAKMLEGDVKVTDPVVADGTVRFTIHAGDGVFKFEGRLPKGDSKTITGNFSSAKDAIPAELERTALTKLNKYELQKESLAKAKGYEVTDVALDLLGDAAENKVKPEEVKGWAEKAYKAAEPYGARVQADVTLQIAETLSKQEGYGEVAVDYARRAERALDPKAKIARTKQVLDVLAEALKKAGKADEAKQVEARIAKLNPEIKPTPFAGRKAKSERVVLVELFTGAQCPPCVAADKAFDALAKTYKPSEVVLLEYHLHIPGPDPLTNTGSEGRFRYYFAGQPRSGTPAIVFNGKPGAQGGGGAFEALEKYDDYMEVINPLLETETKTTLKATAKRTGTKVEITAEAGAGDAPTDGTVRLRLALVEDAVQYKGSNGIPEYHRVVRDLPGGVTGAPVKDKTTKQSVAVDLDEVKKNLKKYLDDYEKENDKFPGKVPEIELKNLRVVAFLQNEKTKEVLQAVQVDVKGEK